MIGGHQQPNPYFSSGQAQIGRPYIIGDPTLSGPAQQAFPNGGPAGMGGNLVGPNSAIFQGGNMGRFQPQGGMGGGMPGMGGPAGQFGPGGMMY